MARGIDRTELLELLAETVNNENPMLHLMEFFLGHLMEAEVEVIFANSCGRYRIYRCRFSHG